MRICCTVTPPGTGIHIMRRVNLLHRRCFYYWTAMDRDFAQLLQPASPAKTLHLPPFHSPLNYPLSFVTKNSKVMSEPGLNEDPIQGNWGKMWSLFAPNGAKCSAPCCDCSFVGELFSFASFDKMTENAQSWPGFARDLRPLFRVWTSQSLSNLYFASSI